MLKALFSYLVSSVANLLKSLTELLNFRPKTSEPSGLEISKSRVLRLKHPARQSIERNLQESTHKDLLVQIVLLNSLVVRRHHRH